MMNLIKRIFGGGSKPASAPSNGFFLNVRCSNCGETFRLFINSSTDLAQDFDEDGRTSYFLNKEIIGAKCRKRIQVRMDFDARKKIVSRKIENGEFID